MTRPRCWWIVGWYAERPWRSSWPTSSMSWASAPWPRGVCDDAGPAASETRTDPRTRSESRRGRDVMGISLRAGFAAGVYHSAREQRYDHGRTNAAREETEHGGTADRGETTRSGPAHRKRSRAVGLDHRGSTDDRQVRGGDRRSPVDPRRRRARQARDARRQDHRPRLSHALAGPAPGLDAGQGHPGEPRRELRIEQGPLHQHGPRGLAHPPDPE